MIKKSLPFECARCASHAPEEFFYFEPTDTWIIIFVEDRLIHVHFGKATASAEESTTETTFLHDHTTAWVQANHPGISFCGVIHVSRADDSELPSDEAVELYKKILSHEQNGITVFYGMTPSMRFFVGMLTHLIKDGKRIHLATTADEAEAEYKTWLAK